MSENEMGEVTPTDLVKSAETAPATETDEDKLKALIQQVKPRLLEDAEFGNFPDGVQYRVMAPIVKMTSEELYKNGPEEKHAAELWGTDEELRLMPELGTFNVMPGTTENGVILDFHPSQPSGKPFEITFGDTFEVNSELGAGKLHERLSSLFNNGTGLNKNESAIHFGPTKSSLQIVNKDGTLKTETASLPPSQTSTELAPSLK